MKIDQSFIYYLLKHKELPLQGIGTFKLEGTITEPPEGKPFVIPADAISFTYNPRIGEDPQLVDFISETTGKIKPLASADLDSFLTLGRQFLNIGKPLILPNIGTIEKTNTGELVYKGGEYTMERVTPTRVSTEVEEVETEVQESFSDFPSRKRNAGRSILYFFILILLGLTVWALWRYAFDMEDEADTITHTYVTPTEQPGAQQPDSAALAAADTTSARAANDTIGFNIVVGLYNKEGGEKRLQDMKLAGRNVILYTTDSVTYKVAEPFPTLPLRDSNRIKDSMRRYYGERVYLIER